MDTYQVTITEKLCMTVEVEAESREEAEQLVSENWHHDEYPLDAEHFDGVSFKAKPLEQSRAMGSHEESAFESNAGYTIKERFAIGEVGFVLGERDTELAGYVTWQFRTDSPTDYFWGHYHNTKDAAYADYQSRIEEEAISQFERTGIKPLLPPCCYAVTPSEGELILIRRGELGYYPEPFSSASRERNQTFADHTNARMNVTKQQVEAMTFGSMFGWESKMADPRSYDDHGAPKRDRKRSRPER